MGLSCSCDYDVSDFDWWWEDHSDFKPLDTSKRKRCTSCKNLIDIGSDTIEFYRYRHPRDIIEERIHGDERVSIASSYMCEDCSGLYLALDELGYDCLNISEPMKDYIAEYNEMRKQLKETKP